MYKAKFIITTSNELEPKPEDIIKEYDITYTDEVDLKSQFEEARKVWEEYYVVAVAGFIIMGSSHTYRDEWWKNEQLMQMHYDLSQED
jgi:hypothetical protein